MMSRTLLHVLSLPLLSVCAPALSAADLAQWSAGDGEIGTQAAAAGAGIAAGTTVHAGTAPARVEFANGVEGTITLAPNTSISLGEGTADGRPTLTLAVLQGAAQVELHRKGSYAELDVTGGGLQVRVTGTLFIVEHGAHDNGWVSLIRGAVRVRNALLNKATTTWLALKEHQGVGIGDDGSLQPIVSLTLRPQLVSLSGQAISIKGQSSATSATAAAAASWHQDVAGGAVLLSAMHTGTVATIISHDPDAAAQGVAALAASGQHGADCDQLVALVGQNAPRALAAFVGALAVHDPAHADKYLTTAILTVPTAAADLVTAAIQANPNAAVDLAVAALVAAPNQAQGILNAAIAAAPGQEGTIAATALTLYPGLQVPANLAAGGAKPAAGNQSPTAPSSTFSLPSTPTPSSQPSPAGDLTAGGTPEMGGDVQGTPLLSIDASVGGNSAPVTPAFTSPQTTAVSPER